MLKAIIGGLLSALFFSDVAMAQTCGAYTYPLTNGTTADASQVMNNFTKVWNCVNALASGGTLTNTTLAGSTSLTGTFSGTITSTAGDNVPVLTDASAVNGVTYIRLQNSGGEVILGVQNSTGNGIIANTDANDTAVFSSKGIAFSANSGAAMQMHLTSTGLSVYGTLQVSTGASANQIRLAQTTPPSCSNCGTGATVVGTDTAMIVTMGGSLSTTNFTIAFNPGWGSVAPSCIGQMAMTGMGSTKMPYIVTTSPSALTFYTNTGVPASGDKYAFHCLGVAL